MSLFAIIAVSIVLAQSEAPAPSLEQSLAAVIADSMTDAAYPWALEWDAFGIYGSRDVRWHLAPPSAGYSRSPLPPGITQRTGWMTVGGRTASVSVCGDDHRVGAMTLNVGDLWLEDGDLTMELAQVGVTATLVEQQDQPPGIDERSVDSHYLEMVTARPAYRLMRLAHPDREPALLAGRFRCTGPGTRSATRCEMSWTVELRAARAPRPEICVAPASPHVRLD